MYADCTQFPVSRLRHPFTIMKNILLFVLLTTSFWCSAVSSHADQPGSGAAAAAEVQLTGTLEQRMAIGGETTGWSLRYGEKKRVELLLPVDALARIKDGLVVSVTGVYGTKHYPERGDVVVFTVKKITQVVP